MFSRTGYSRLHTVHCGPEGIYVSALGAPDGGSTGRHPTWVGMRVNFWDLTTWSWLMASAHGAGLMVVPVLLGGKSAFCGAIPSGTNSLLFFDP